MALGFPAGTYPARLKSGELIIPIGEIESMALIINSGDLHHKISFKSPVTLLNAEGEPEMTFITSHTTFAKVVGVDERRIVEANAVAMLGSKNFFIRWSTLNDSISKDWILVYEGKDYVINEIERISERQRFIRINAKSKHG